MMIYIPFSSRAQYAVLQKLGIRTVFAVVGFSMGGQQVSLHLHLPKCDNLANPNQGILLAGCLP